MMTRLTSPIARTFSPRAVRSACRLKVLCFSSAMTAFNAWTRSIGICRLQARAQGVLSAIFGREHDDAADRGPAPVWPRPAPGDPGSAVDCYLRLANARIAADQRQLAARKASRPNPLDGLGLDVGHAVELQNRRWLARLLVAHLAVRFRDAFVEGAAEGPRTTCTGDLVGVRGLHAASPSVAPAMIARASIARSPMRAASSAAKRRPSG